jgi:hypothetical protein
VVFKMYMRHLQRYVGAKSGFRETTFAKAPMSLVPIHQVRQSWGVGGGWSKSPYLTRSVIHNQIMSGECRHITNSKANHLKWIGQVW